MPEGTSLPFFPNMAKRFQIGIVEKLEKRPPCTKLCDKSEWCSLEITALLPIPSGKRMERAKTVIYQAPSHSPNLRFGKKYELKCN